MIYNPVRRLVVSISDEKPVPAPQSGDTALAAAATAFQSQMRSRFPRHQRFCRGFMFGSLVSISDEKPVPAPPLKNGVDRDYNEQFQSQMRSRFPRHLPLSHDGACREFWFQSQMRSRFPRHEKLAKWAGRFGIVSISDEKPVPAPHHSIALIEHTNGSFNLR